MEDFLKEVMGNEIIVTVDANNIITQFTTTINNATKDGYQLLGSNGAVICLNELCNFNKTNEGWIINISKYHQMYVAFT